MAREQVDILDVAFLFVAFVGATTMAGLAAWDVFGIGFQDTLISAADMGFLNQDLSLAYVMGLGSAAATILTNDNAEVTELYRQSTYGNLDNGQLYWIAVVGTGALYVLWPVISEIPSAVTGSDFLGVLVVAGTLMFQAVVGYFL
jgi:hypothetical protein